MGNTELQRFIDNKSLVAIKKFAKAEAQLKELKAEHDAIIDRLRVAMIEHVKNGGDRTLKGDWGSITLAERTTYSTDDIDQVPLNLTKRVLDTGKVKAQAVLNGVLPSGISESKTQYITKRLKDV